MNAMRIAWDKLQRLIQVEMIETGWRRACKELRRRGLVPPEPTDPQPCPPDQARIGYRYDGERLVCAIGASWDGSWEVWGWASDDKDSYWSVERTVRREPVRQLVIARLTKEQEGATA